jgi:hypothetical protein
VKAAAEKNATVDLLQKPPVVYRYALKDFRIRDVRATIN